MNISLFTLILIIAESKEECAEVLHCLILLLRKLGFSIQWGKVVDPSNVITFLEVELGSLNMTLRLPMDNLDTLKLELANFRLRKCATKRQLQSLVGRMSWAAGVVRGGRVFLRRIFNKISTLKHNSHKTMLSLEVRRDLDKWSEFLHVFNGRSCVLDQKPIECLFTDACVNAAGGYFGMTGFILICPLIGLLLLFFI